VSRAILEAGTTLTTRPRTKSEKVRKNLPMFLLRRRTVRLRLTVLYGATFLLTGAGLLVIAGLVTVGSSSRVSTTAPAPGQQPSTQALAQARAQIRHLQNQLAAEAGQGHQSLWHPLLIGSLVALCVMVAVSVVLGWFVANRVLRPLRKMTAATRRISADNLHERLAVPGPVDEVKDLADTIDELLERLEGAFAAQRRFVANASHELRTPLATMRASLDVAEAKPEPAPPQTTALAGRLRTELDQVDRLLEGLLVLARAQHGDLPGHTMLSLDAVVSAALAARTAATAAQGLTVRSTSGPDGTWVQGSQALICRMVDNVMDNAVTHNARGGWIKVRTEANGPTAWLVVETGGDVLDQQQVQQLAQPFRRLGADRTGSGHGAGLGLSIVAAIAEAHGGTLDLYARPEGGLRVSIGLPLARTAVPA
jgi:signal transduction histidine kinase